MLVLFLFLSRQFCIELNARSRFDLKRRDSFESLSATSLRQFTFYCVDHRYITSKREYDILITQTML